MVGRGLHDSAMKTVKLTRRAAGVPIKKAAGSRTSVHVGCWTHEYESLFQRDRELQAKYLATGTRNASKFAEFCCDVLCDCH
jgi:hypothetical protein